MENQEYIEYLKNLFQREIHIIKDGKALRKGKLQLFSIDNFHITFKLVAAKNPDKVKTFEVPYPFKMYMHDGALVFDYKLKTFSNGDDELLIKAKKIKSCDKSKFYDTELVIKPVDEL